jgi:hypothetical protein
LTKTETQSTPSSVQAKAQAKVKAKVKVQAQAKAKVNHPLRLFHQSDPPNLMLEFISETGRFTEESSGSVPLPARKSTASIMVSGTPLQES